MSVATNVDVLADEWIQRLCVNNQVDLNLQLPAANESTKIEVPTLTLTLPESSSPTGNYLSSIFAASNKVTACSRLDDCACYKCQRLRRRTGVHNKLSMATMIRSRSVRNNASQSPSHPPLKRNQSLCVRKAPEVGAALVASNGSDRHSQQDTIDRFHAQQPNAPRQSVQMRSPLTGRMEEDDDKYEISWKDETGDDILPSLRTFQTIFEEKPEDICGLSELLERRARELKQKREEQELTEGQAFARNAGLRTPPPPRDDCCTLSYRNGPSHRQLTLYHTMKMRFTDERVEAYDRAFLHCVQARSGLETWLSRQAARGVPDAMTSYKPMRSLPSSVSRHSWSMKGGGSLRTMLHPILPGRKHRVVAEDLWTRTKGDMPTTPVSPSYCEPSTPLTDILSATQTLIPSRSPLLFFRQPSPREKSYDHIDFPSRPLTNNSSRQKDRDSTSLLSSQGDSSTVTGRSTTSSNKPASLRLFASFGRRSLRTRHENSSTHSLESKIECSDENLSIKGRKRANTSTDANSGMMTIHEIAARMASKPSSIKEDTALESLAEIMPHVDRATLCQYLDQAEGDYTKALLLCRQAAITE